MNGICHICLPSLVTFASCVGSILRVSFFLATEGNLRQRRPECSHQHQRYQGWFCFGHRFTLSAPMPPEAQYIGSLVPATACWFGFLSSERGLAELANTHLATLPRPTLPIPSISQLKLFSSTPVCPRSPHSRHRHGQFHHRPRE